MGMWAHVQKEKKISLLPQYENLLHFLFFSCSTRCILPSEMGFLLFIYFLIDCPSLVLSSSLSPSFGSEPFVLFSLVLYFRNECQLHGEWEHVGGSVTILGQCVHITFVATGIALETTRA